MLIPTQGRAVGLSHLLGSLLVFVSLLNGWASAPSDAHPTPSPLSPVCDTPVLRVIDGDTFRVLVLIAASPQYVFIQEMSVRVARVDTPERGHPQYAEATQLARTILRGQRVLLQQSPGVPRLDSFGRLLAEVFVCQPDGTTVHLNAILRDRGWTWKNS